MEAKTVESSAFQKLGGCRANSELENGAQVLAEVHFFISF